MNNNIQQVEGFRLPPRVLSMIFGWYFHIFKFIIYFRNRHLGWFFHCCITCTPSIKCPHGYSRKNFCGECNKKLMCTGCGLFMVRSGTNVCASCKPSSHRNKKSRQNSTEGIEAIYLVKKLEHVAYWSGNYTPFREFGFNYRPDFIYITPNKTYLLEVDEHSHTAYDNSCELSRINTLISTLLTEDHMHYVHVIRSNPDPSNTHRARQITFEEKL
ncbi:hypothetical protein BDA99DRAFT_544490 [Phascolomyces articulosus]|uniref:Uncharacterized protein n=1 Tax=Phascolomyces articulosus TaxID=60185 RepID=A0AAD5P6V7_9FUNG|nr:hypothetical protein BDA99DRAFT_544490 [Phascolomyces articulosus]